LGTKIQVIGLAFASAIALEAFVPGFFSNAARQLRINFLINELRGVQNTIFREKVEEVTASQTPSPTNEAIPGGL